MACIYIVAVHIPYHTLSSPVMGIGGTRRYIVESAWGDGMSVDLLNRDVSLSPTPRVPTKSAHRPPPFPPYMYLADRPKGKRALARTLYMYIRPISPYLYIVGFSHGGLSIPIWTPTNHHIIPPPRQGQVVCRALVLLHTTYVRRHATGVHASTSTLANILILPCTQRICARDSYNRATRGCVWDDKCLLISRSAINCNHTE